MKKFVLILIVMAVLLCSVSCAKIEKDSDLDSTDNAVVDSKDSVADDEKDEEESDSSKEFYKSDAEVYEINSKHCSLYFPTEWKDNVETVVYEDGEIYEVRFNAVFDTDSIPLYSFVFGESEEGYLLGNVKTDIGDQDVYLVDMSSQYDGELSEDDEYTYYAMCEGVNDIISNLVYVSGMTLAD